MKVILAGGTGFIGNRLVRKLLEENHHVVVLTRRPDSSVAKSNPEYVFWDGKNIGSWSAYFDGADAVLNFAGESIGAKRWTKKQKEKIISSRVNATNLIVQAIRSSKEKPPVLVNASAVGYYGSIEKDIDVDESFTQGNGFLADVCNQWETEARNASASGVRVVLLRMGVVLGEQGGALERLLLPFKLFAGGPLGSGRQWFPWIHVEDLIDIILYVTMKNDINGAVNVTAPQPVTMKQFCSVLGEVMHRPLWAPVPSLLLKIMFGEMSSMILTGQKVVPAKLLRSGFPFRYPRLDQALQSIL